MDFHDAHSGDPSGCGCCGSHATETLLNEMAVMQLQRVALDYAGLEKVRRAEDGDAPFVPHEVKLTEILAEHAAEVADEAEKPILDALNRDYVDPARISNAANAAAAIWQAKSWPSTLEAEIADLIDNASLTGAHAIPFGPELGDLDRLRIVNGMVASAKYTTNNYFNTQVMPALVDAANLAVMDGKNNDAVQLRQIHAMLDRRLRSVPYWNVVANAAASRAYHFGYLKVGVAKGWDTVVFTATIDSVTSEMCQNLNGTKWRAADVALFADRIAAAKDVDALKEISPWKKVDDIADWSPKALLDLGVVIPPVHGRCRSRLVFT